MARANERDRFKYGVCTNRDKDGKPCPKCESKEVQRTRMGQDFVCEECKEPLRQVPPPKTGPNKGLIAAIIAVAVLLVGGGMFYMLQDGKEKTSVPPAVDSIVTNPVEVDTTNAVPVNVNPTDGKGKEKEKTPKATKDGYGTLDLGYAIYTGDIKNGKPHGNGTLEYKKSQKIISSKDYVASPGEKVKGSFRNGKINLATWYQNDGNQVVIK